MPVRVVMLVSMHTARAVEFDRSRVQSFPTAALALKTQERYRGQ